jgi:ABC-type Na+ efflux pump permease subunit
MVEAARRLLLKEITMKRRLVVTFLILVVLVAAGFAVQTYLPGPVAQKKEAPQRGNSKGLVPVPVTADYEMVETRALANGNVLERTVKGKYFRDDQGRVRREQSGMVTITDPNTATSYVLDAKSKTARKLVQQSGTEQAAAATRPEPNVTNLNKPAVERAALGERQIEGVTASGKEFVSTIPANSKIGNRDPIEVTFEVWMSDEVQLPVLTVVKDPVNGDKTQRYVNIKKGAKPNPSLFKVPGDYNVVDVGKAAR